MKIYTKIYIDHTGAVTECDWYEYTGDIAECKGGASKQEQAAADQQRNQENQLMQQQLNMQMGQLNSVNSVLDPMIANGGLAPGVQNAMTSLVMNQLPQTYRQGVGAINNALAARGISGGQAAGSGDIGRDFGAMASALGNQQQQGLSNIQLAKQGALMNDLGLKMGIGSQFGANVGGFNQGALGALGQGVTAAHNVDQAQTSWMGPLFGALGSIGGSFMTGGMSNLGKGKGFFG